jgi:hypothetical protein
MLLIVNGRETAGLGERGYGRIQGLGRGREKDLKAAQGPARGEKGTSIHRRVTNMSETHSDIYTLGLDKLA